jgi:hypothetical protein
MGRWLTLYRDLTSATTDEDKRRIVDDFLARPMCPVSHDMSPSVIGRRLGFSDSSSLTEVERNAVTLARWILKERPNEVHVRALLREARLPGLRSAEQIKAAAKLLVDADWLRTPVIGFGARRKVAYPVNHELWGL